METVPIEQTTLQNEERRVLGVLAKRNLSPGRFAESVAGWTLDSWQARVMESESSRIILNCCRQSGKSTTAALLALYTAVHPKHFTGRDRALVLLLSPSLRQSSELFQKVLDLYRSIAEYVPTTQESALRLRLDNGSRIISLPGKEQTVRGYSGVALLVVDEAARTPDDLYRAVRPMLAVSGGRLVLLSTPWGKQGFFFETWEKGGDEWLKIKLPATECVRISKAFLEEERRVLGQWWYSQEYLCTFEESKTAIFTDEEIKAAFAKEVKSWEL